MLLVKIFVISYRYNLTFIGLSNRKLNESNFIANIIAKITLERPCLV